VLKASVLIFQAATLRDAAAQEYLDPIPVNNWSWAVCEVCLWLAPLVTLAFLLGEGTSFLLLPDSLSKMKLPG